MLAEAGFVEGRILGWTGTPCIKPPREVASGAALAVYANPDGLPFSVAGSLSQEGTG
jgi:hypothetical protein